MDLKTCILARIPGIHLRTIEEVRGLEQIMISTYNTNRKVYSWTTNEGLREIKIDEFELNYSEPKIIQGIGILQEKFYETNQNSIFVMKDPWDELSQLSNIRILREMLIHARETGKMVIILGKDWNIPIELQQDIYVINLELPNRKQLEEHILSLIEEIEENEKLAEKIKINKDSVPELANACSGLTLSEVRNIVTLSIMKNKSIDKETIKLAIQEKKQIIQRNKILYFSDERRNINEIGGLNNLKEWITKRVRLFSKEARDFGIYPPKGVLLLGVPGTGKSLCAKVFASILNVPLIKLDAGKLFGSLVGQSEENLRSVFSTVEAISPCVLMIDELEKSFAQGGLDGGTSQRVFGSLLSWLQDKTAPVFVIATANDISKLPPELLRKGRFDEIFFVDLPTKNSRKEIINIFTKDKIKLTDDGLTILSDNSEGFSGSEIEQSIQDSLINAFYEERKLEFNDIKTSLSKTKPLSVTMEERIKSIQEWVKQGRCISAHIEKEQSKKKLRLDS